MSRINAQTNERRRGSRGGTRTRPQEKTAASDAISPASSPSELPFGDVSPPPTCHSQLGTGIASRKPSDLAHVNLRHTATPVSRTLWHGQGLASLSVWVLSP